jgi:membrane protease YdiL (CAAX protease family)
MLVTVALVVAPIAEEVYFRGLILGGLLQSTRLPWVSIALSAAVFGAVHAAQPQVVAPIVTLGLILGYVRVRMNSLRLCIAIHALFNGRTMALILLDPSQLR